MGNGLTARSVVASTLLGTHPPRLPGRLLVAFAEEFGINPGTTRVALTRMVDRGELARVDGGHYSLAGALLDRQARPVFEPWVAHFNLFVAAALIPACFTGLAMEGPVAWDGLLTFWVRNAVVGLWIVVMGVVLGRTIHRQRSEETVAT